MIATTAQTVQHEPWCNDHQHQDADPSTFLEEHDACKGVILRERGVEVIVDDSEDNGGTVTVFAADVSLTATQAREVAATLLSAAIIVEEAG